MVTVVFEVVMVVVVVGGHAVEHLHVVDEAIVAGTDDGLVLFDIMIFKLSIRKQLCR